MGIFGKTRAALKAMRDMQKSGGMLLCIDCMKAQMAKSSPNATEAMKSSLESKMYTSITEGECFVCSKPAKYKVELSNAMKAIQAHGRG